MGFLDWFKAKPKRDEFLPSNPNEGYVPVDYKEWDADAVLRLLRSWKPSADWKYDKDYRHSLYQFLLDKTGPDPTLARRGDETIQLGKLVIFLKAGMQDLGTYHAAENVLVENQSKFPDGMILYFCGKTDRYLFNRFKEKNARLTAHIYVKENL